MFREHNLTHRNYDIYGIRQFKYSDLDHATDPLVSNLVRDNFYIDSKGGYESLIVLKVRKKFPELNQYISGKKFYNLYRLLGYLLSEGQYELEKKILKYTVSDISNLTIINYIDLYYFQPAQKFVKDRQYFRARWMIREGLSRLLLDDSNPLVFRDVNYDRYLNKVILLRALLNNPEDIFMEEDRFNYIYNILNCEYNCDFEDSYKLNFPTDSRFNSILKLIQGIHRIQQRNYDEAFFLLKQAYKINDNNLFLKDINLHLIARCVFWNCNNKNFKNKNSSIEKLKEIRKSISINNLKTDIDFYIEYLMNSKLRIENKRGSNIDNYIFNLDIL